MLREIGFMIASKQFFYETRKGNDSYNGSFSWNMADLTLGDLNEWSGNNVIKNLARSQVYKVKSIPLSMF